MGHLTWIEVIKGSWLILSVLSLCSIVSVAVILQKIFYFKKITQQLGELKSSLEYKSDKSKIQETIKSFKVKELSKIFTDKAENSDRRVLEFIHVSKQGLWILGTLGNAAPFLGLLGTVIGIIKSFRDMAQEGSGGFAVVAAGISEALIATAAGLIVAITASVFFNYFNVRLREINQASKFIREELKDQHGI